MKYCVDCDYYAAEADRTKCSRCIWTSLFGFTWNHIGMIMSADGDGMLPCRCADDCDGRYCAVCWDYSCEYPGACWGRCRECGDPARPHAILTHHFDLYCSDKCSKEFWDRCIQEGSILATSELTPEQLNRLLNTAGLGISGVGLVESS